MRKAKIPDAWKDVRKSPRKKADWMTIEKKKLSKVGYKKRKK